MILTSLDDSIIASARRNPPHWVCRQWLHLTPFSSCCRKLEVGSEWGSGNRDEASSRMSGVGVMAPQRGGKTWGCKRGSGNQWESAFGGDYSIRISQVMLVYGTRRMLGVILRYAQVIKCVTRHTSLQWHHLHLLTNTHQISAAIIKYFSWITIICCADHGPSEY